MNFKNKVISFVMSFVICFCTVSSSFANDKKSLNYNIQPLVVDGGVISAPMLATVATLAVATGVVINDDVDLYSLGSMFYEHNKKIWDTVVLTFNSAVAFNEATKKVTIGKDFLDIFNNTFSEIKNSYVSGFYGSIPIYDGDLVANSSTFAGGFVIPDRVGKYYIGDISFEVSGTNNSSKLYQFYKGVFFGRTIANPIYYPCSAYLVLDDSKYNIKYVQDLRDGTYQIAHGGVLESLLPFPNIKNYDDTIIKDKDKTVVSVPSDVGSLKGLGSSDVLSSNPPYDVGLSPSFPSIDNPSIDIDDSFSFPLEGDIPSDTPSDTPSDVPSEGIWATIKDFVISLVVPSDTFWTDTFNGFKENFSKNFPMLDMSKFDSLVVGGKPFPNLYAYGSKIVDGDVINSIVDWLRPIIAGFIMICLMFFNYRKIYKLIRNTEPFGGIAQGSSDFRTGLSAPPINNGLDSNPMGNLRDTLFDMRNEILRRENEK